MKESKNRYISFVTTPTLKEALNKAAQEEERSVSWIIGRAVEEFLTKKGYLKKNRLSGR